jgi:hypothetical protein
MLDRPSKDRGKANRWQADYRARQRNGRIVAPVEADADVVGFLIRTKWLAESDAHDRRAIGRAITAVMKDAAKD